MPNACFLRPVFSLLMTIFLTLPSMGQDRINLQIPTAESEVAYIWQTIRDISFFEEHGYQVSLPAGELVEELKEKARAGRLSDSDFERLEGFFKDNVYQPEDYRAGYEKIKAELPRLNDMLQTLAACEYVWGFQLFEQYEVRLTLYGPGGSYDPDAGSIIIYTTPDGRFKSYDNPINTLIHEMVHIGIENSIIRKYKVPHTLKERIVDTIVLLHFGSELPDYRAQEMGESRTDERLTSLAELQHLDQIVEDVLGQD
ncbi:hypothetical protein [Pontibacter sp. G13]|uniref:hypothetical protein n=1 Tax=Pontibacter sp. G13 TaxID=3074898 RepID=UPI002889F3C2|nr:hypothetical protein [Pontibacter sp. G13]WNJ19044.1 hypothetical protein RJD25_01015 [Pontibacter sp. G13]